MSWTANIILKSNKKASVEKLLSINSKSSSDSSITELKDFKTFHLVSKQRLSFIGEKSIVTLNSDEIEYVELIQYN